MFLLVSKLGWFLIAPSNLLTFLAVLGGLVWLVGSRRFGAALASFALILLLVAGLSPLGNVLTAVLEERFPPWQAEGRVPTGIIVLGGWTDTIVSGFRGEHALNDRGERPIEAIALARRYPSARLVFSGGDGNLLGQSGSEAEDARRLSSDLGIDPARVAYERMSQNTWENARFTRDLVQPKAGELWLVVTSAWHMPRAIGCFRAIGFDVEAYPVDYRTRGLLDVTRGFPSVAEGLTRVDVATREWVGLLSYRLVGRSAALFPAP